jgi:hypothetical protein
MIPPARALLGLLIACATAAGARAAAAAAPAPVPALLCPWTVAKSRAALENDLAFLDASSCGALTDAVVEASFKCDIGEALGGSGSALAADRAGNNAACTPSCAAFREMVGPACFDAHTTTLFKTYALVNASAAAGRALPPDVRALWASQLEVLATDCPANANVDPDTVDESILRRARGIAAIKRHKYAACVAGPKMSVAETEAEAEAAAAAAPALPEAAAAAVATVASGAVRRVAAGAALAALAAATLA